MIGFAYAFRLVVDFMIDKKTSEAVEASEVSH